MTARTCRCGKPISRQAKTGRCRSCCAIDNNNTPGRREKMASALRAARRARALVKRPVPNGFAAVAADLSLVELARRFKAGQDTCAMWRKQLGIKYRAQKGAEPLPIPADFAELMPTMSITAATVYWRRSYSTVVKWIEKTGVSAKRYRPAQFVRTVEKPRTFIPRGSQQMSALPAYNRDTSPVGLAAEFLRRDCPVYRCDPRGRFDEKGAGWRVGNVQAVFSDAELIERADTKRGRMVA